MNTTHSESRAEQVLHEPVQGVFNTQHSGPHNKAIALNGLILLTEIGSTVHGCSLDPTGGSSDVDEMGICIEPLTEVMILNGFEQYEYRTQKVNQRSHAGDIDRTVYGLRKWAKLAAAGNPTVLTPLFVPVEHDRYVSPLGQNLLMSAHLFISQQAGHKFLGYLDGQRKRYMDPTRVDSKHASRPELVAKYGWDTKTGYHALRLAIQGKELMDTGSITLPMNDHDRQFLLRVRNGEFTKQRVTDLLDLTFIPDLKHAIETSELPEKPDYDAINEFLATMHRTFWEQGA